MEGGKEGEEADPCTPSLTYNIQYKSIMLQLSQLVALLAGFLVMLVNGSLYVYGTMTPYIITYLYYQGKACPTQEIRL